MRSFNVKEYFYLGSTKVVRNDAKNLVTYPVTRINMLFNSAPL